MLVKTRSFLRRNVIAIYRVLIVCHVLIWYKHFAHTNGNLSVHIPINDYLRTFSNTAINS